jgi:hypothetical protein
LWEIDLVIGWIHFMYTSMEELINCFIKLMTKSIDVWEFLIVNTGDDLNAVMYNQQMTV